MNPQPDHSEGVWFIYDGECPVCSHAAHALRIKEKFGAIHLLDARSNGCHPLLQAVNFNGLDLDEGMVIMSDGRFHHGDKALEFMARHGAPTTPFTAITKALFWSPSLARLLYPFMRGTRNLLLRIKGVDQIRNLDRNSETD